METSFYKVDNRLNEFTLKPSLVEWKHLFHSLFPPYILSLKPSLVEWKRLYRPSCSIIAFFLETFLSGMETFLSPFYNTKNNSGLETFLSGMETFLEYRK